MRDLVVLAIIAAFFVACAAYVRWCDRIIGPDPERADDVPRGDRDELVAS